MPQLKIANCGQGVNLDLMPEELPDGVWSACQNMRARNGFAERFKGMANLFGTPSVTPYWITPYGTSTARYWIHAGIAKVFADDGTTRTEITPASAPTGAIDDRWTGGTLNGVLVMNNGVNVPLYWGGNVANDLASLPGWDANERCKALRPFKNFLIALNITKTSTNYPHMVKWSHSADPGTVPTSWDETDVTKDAGEQDIAETPDLIVDGLPLGDAFIIYKERSMYAMTTTGDARIFRFQRLPGDVGMLTRGCAVNTPLGHVVLAAGDVVLNNGQGAVSIADGQIREYIFSAMNGEKSNRSFVCANPQKNEVLICFPTGESEFCDKAAVWNWKDKSWGLRNLDNVTYGDAGQVNADTTLIQWDASTLTWESSVNSWNENEYSPNEARLLFSRTTAISAFDIGSTDFGTIMNASLERVGWSAGDPYTNKLIRGIHPRIDAPAGTVLTVSVGGSMVATEAPTYGDPVTFTVGTDQKIDVLVSGRFFGIKVESSDYAPWRLRSFDVDVVPMGAF